MEGIRNIDYVMAYARSLGMVRLTDTEVDTIAPLAPFIVMDVVYQLYHESVERVEWSHELNRYKGRWSEAYTTFNTRLFRAFNEEMQMGFVEKMDDFNESIHHTLTLSRLACMECFKEIADVDQQKVLASVLMAHTLTHHAKNEYESYFRTYYGTGELKAIRYATEMFSEAYLDRYMGKRHLITKERFETAINNLSAHIKVLIRQIDRWIDNDDRKSQENNG